MAADPNQPTAGPSPASDEQRLWMPPTRLRRYQRNKIIGALLFCAIFAIWLVVQWSNPAMRFTAAAMIAMTVWVTIASVRRDASQARGRQIAVEGDTVTVLTPQARTSFEISQVAHASWQDAPPEQAGLSFYDREGRLLAQLDTETLVDEPEARTFIGWLRRQTGSDVQVRWEE